VTDSPVGLLVATAQESLVGIREMPDYRARYIHVAFAGVQAACALALAVDRLAGAIEPKENP
jgi:hypothetical protein